MTDGEDTTVNDNRDDNMSQTAQPGANHNLLAILHGSLSFINNFSGTDGKFPISQFFNEIDSVANLAGVTRDENAKLMILKSKLMGEARDFLHQTDIRGLTFKEVKNLLRERFSRTPSIQDSFSDLASCKQKSGENILAYANKIKAKVFRMMPSDNTGNNEGLGIYRDQFMTSIFINGLLPALMDRVLSIEPEKFEEAVQAAMKANKIEEQLRGNAKINKGICFFDVPFSTNCNITKKYGCPEIKSGTEPEGIDCWCRSAGAPVKIQRPNCGGTPQKTRIVKRELHISEHPKVPLNMDHINVLEMPSQMKDNLWKVEQWIVNNPVTVAVILLSTWTITGNTFHTIVLSGLILSVAPVYGDNCVNLAKRDFIQGVSGGTWVDVVLTQGSCVTIMAPSKPTFDVNLRVIATKSPVAAKDYCVEIKTGSSDSADHCPSRGEASLDEEKDGDYQCQRGTSDRGWGNGCGIFAKGSVVTCVKTTCRKHLNTSLAEPKDVEYRIMITLHQVSQNTSKTTRFVTLSDTVSEVNVDLGDYGGLGVTCSVFSGFDLIGYALLEIDGKSYLVHKEWLADLHLPWRYPGGHCNHMDRLMTWETPDATSIDYNVLVDQSGAVLRSI